MDPLQDAYTQILTEIGEDLERDGLRDTPKRAAKAMQFLTRGYQESLETVVNGAIFESDSEDMVIVRNIELYSPVSYTHLTLPTICSV